MGEHSKQVEFDERHAELGALVAGLAHELRNALNSLKSGSQLLNERGDDLTLRNRLLPVMIEGAERMERSLNALDRFTRISPEDELIDLQEAVEVVFALLKFHTRGVVLDRDLDALHTSLPSPRDSLFVILKSVRALLASKPKALRISGAIHGDWIELRIEARLLDPASWCDPSHELRGSRNIMDEFGGRLDVVTSDEQGGAIVLEWPAQRHSAVHVQDPLR